ncbi:hypothetical protein WG901_13870 [Novosphingobium sp. PS1R-30]|uniref:Uncharacterized protein n=1 Tax=Novosphingobium anseongense TaxID=3133436 RepID=A0ABU8RXH1_9SPHN
MTRLALALLLAVGLPASTLAEPPAAKPVAAEARFVPTFAPPLGQPLLYRLTTERSTPVVKTQAVFDQQVVFERLGDDGFVMRFQWLRVTQGGRSYDLAKDIDSFPVEARAMFAPMAMELDANGRPLRMRDWQKLREGLIDMSPLMARGLEDDPARRAATESFLRNFLKRYAALSAEEAVNHMVRGWPQVLAELGSEVELGREAQSIMQAPSPFSAEPIDYATAVIWTRTDEGRTLHLTRRSTPSPEGLRAVGEGLTSAVKQFRPPGKRADPAEIRRMFADMKLSMQTEIDFDRATGLLRKAVFEKSATTNGQQGTDRITLTAL